MPTSKIIRPAVFDETGEHVIPADADLNLDPVSSDPDNYIVRGSDGGAFLNGDGVLSNDGENLLKITPNDGKVTYPRSDAVNLITETVQPFLDTIDGEAASAQKAMVRELERAFFTEANTQGTAYTAAAGATIAEAIEGLIQSVETVDNDYVDGVERDMIAVVCKPSVYGQLRTYFDAVSHDGNSESFGTFHGVKVFSSVYLPDGCAAIAMAEGAIAQPVLPTVAAAERIPLSNAIGFGIFYSYGTKAVAADLIFKMADSSTTTTGA